MGRQAAFKRCGCGTAWATRESFIRDVDIDPIGMTTAPAEDSVRVYYYFNHLKCKSTLAMDAEDFAGLIEEPIPASTMTGEEKCPGHCTRIQELDKCDNECRNAPFRRLLVDRIMRKDI